MRMRGTRVRRWMILCILSFLFFFIISFLFHAPKKLTWTNNPGINRKRPGLAIKLSAALPPCRIYQKEKPSCAALRTVDLLSHRQDRGAGATYHSTCP